MWLYFANRLSLIIRKKHVATLQLIRQRDRLREPYIMETIFAITRVAIRLGFLEPYSDSTASAAITQLKSPSP